MLGVFLKYGENPKVPPFTSLHPHPPFVKKWGGRKLSCSLANLWNNISEKIYTQLLLVVAPKLIILYIIYTEKNRYVEMLKSRTTKVLIF